MSEERRLPDFTFEEAHHREPLSLIEQPSTVICFEAICLTGKIRVCPQAKSLKHSIHALTVTILKTLADFATAHWFLHFSLSIRRDIIQVKVKYSEIDLSSEYT